MRRRWYVVLVAENGEVLSTSELLRRRGARSRATVTGDYGPLRERLAEAIHGRPFDGTEHPDDRECIDRTARDVLAALGLEQVGWRCVLHHSWGGYCGGGMREHSVEPVYRLGAEFTISGGSDG